MVLILQETYLKHILLPGTILAMGRPLITCENWNPNTKMDTRWLRLLLEKNFWFSRLLPEVKSEMVDNDDQLVENPPTFY